MGARVWRNCKDGRTNACDSQRITFQWKWKLTEFLQINFLHVKCVIASKRRHYDKDIRKYGNKKSSASFVIIFRSLTENGGNSHHFHSAWMVDVRLFRIKSTLHPSQSLAGRESKVLWTFQKSIEEEIKRWRKRKRMWNVPEFCLMMRFNADAKTGNENWNTFVFRSFHFLKNAKCEHYFQ